MTRWLVTGAGGMLGRDVVAELAGRDVVALRRVDLDITDPAAVAAAVSHADVVVNAAAWTDVDAAESQEDAAALGNGTGPSLLAAACAEHGARLVHVSTDYVFRGDARTPYAEDAPLAPVTAYGRTKAAGERAVRAALPGAYVVRTAWLYGEHGRSFVRTIARLAAERETLDVVDDQQGQPTWSRLVARQLVALVDADAPAGAYHATAGGSTTWHGLARAVLEELGMDPERVRAVTSAQFVRPAPRPAYSVLGHDRWAAAGLPPLPGWRAQLHEAMPAVLRGAAAG